MTPSLNIPKFASETEEAAWWETHGLEVEERWRTAVAEGRTGRGTLVRRAMEAGQAQKSGLIVPKFATESEEADWWYDHREQLGAEFAQAAAEGRLGRGTAMRRALEANTTVQLDTEDVKRAHMIADRKGIPYQAYVKMLVHEALEREAA